jgi:hypothetical protein
MNHREHPSGRRTAAVVWLGLLALIVCFVWLLQARNDTARFGRLHDDTIYLATAQAIASQGRPVLPSLPGEPDQTKYPLLYPYLLSLVWTVSPAFPANLALASSISTVLAIAILVSAFLYLKRWEGIGPGAALFAVAICCSLEPFLVVSSNLLSETLFIFLAIAAFSLGDSESEKGALLAGGVAGLCLLTRSVGITVIAGIAAAYLWRGDRRHLARFCLGATPFLAMAAIIKSTLAAPVPAGALEGFRRTWLYYTDYAGFWRLSVPDMETLSGMIEINVVEMLSVPTNLTLGIRPGDIVSTLIWVTLGIGIIAGLVRQARGDRLRGLHIALALHAPFVLLWNYEIADRLLLLFQPFFAIGLWVEGGHAVRGFARNLSARRPTADRVIAATALVLLSVLVAYAVRANIELHAAAVRRHPDNFQDLYRDVYRWVEQNTEPEDRFLAIDDVYLYLHTGRQAMWPLALTTEPRFRPDASRLEDQMSRIEDVAKYIDADYLIWTEHDYAYAPPMQERWRSLAESRQLVMSRDDGRVKVFKLQRDPQESPGS